MRSPSVPTGYSLLTRDTSGQTMLHYAVRYGHKEIAKYLIRFAPSLLNLQDSNLDPQWQTICCMLVAGGASLSIADHRGLTPKLLAVQLNDQEMIAYLENQEHFQMISSEAGTDV
ncbi:unnamed protein product [Callosobruchus maculatus]|uniref:Uncharacterized protein n=1 Tax=Callosobruchus maculatus TaxID=64391 RepID=A0A653C7V8_CALMS|nr:unnamed protein product [Callosobruchus maculatus]